MEKTGFEILKTRKVEDKIDIAVLEKQYNLKLPPLYRLFAKTFILGEFEESFNFERFYPAEKNGYYH